LGDAVLGHLKYECDLPAAEACYHQNGCWNIRFLTFSYPQWSLNVNLVRLAALLRAALMLIQQQKFGRRY